MYQTNITTLSKSIVHPLWRATCIELESLYMWHWSNTTCHQYLTSTYLLEIFLEPWVLNLNTGRSLWVLEALHVPKQSLTPPLFINAVLALSEKPCRDQRLVLLRDTKKFNICVSAHQSRLYLMTIWGTGVLSEQWICGAFSLKTVGEGGKRSKL